MQDLASAVEVAMGLQAGTERAAKVAMVSLGQLLPSQSSEAGACGSMWLFLGLMQMQIEYAYAIY